MADESKSKAPEPPPRPRDLGWLERLAAAILGLGGVGVGGTGIFLSDNQAGTTTILLIGALFLLLAVQGTAILKVGKEGAELERRAAGRELTKQAVEAVEERKDPEQAAGLAEAARRVDPNIVDDPAYGYLSSAIFERRMFDLISHSLSELRATGEVDIPEDSSLVTQPSLAGMGSGRADAVLTMPGRGQVLIEMRSISARSSMATDNMVASAVDQMRRLLKKQGGGKGLVVVDTAYDRSLNLPFTADTSIAVVAWRSERDTPELKDALRRLLVD